jgi:ABC-type transporter Mla MlaB component
LQGETVQVEDLEPDTTGSGTSHNSKLTLTLKTRDGTFVLEGQLEKRSLTGTWRQQDATPKGTWSASPVDTIPVERRSPALAVLREYRRLPDGRSDYSAQPQPLAGYEPTGRELCRVWKAPGSVLVLDWKAKPIPVGGK